MSQLTDRLERDLREIAAGAHASPSAWHSIVSRLGDGEGSEVPGALPPTPDGSKRPLWIAVAAALAVIAGTAVLVTGGGDDAVSTDPSPATVPALPPGTSGGWWPQSNLDEVDAAQARADAGDPASTWQLDVDLADEGEPWDAEIFTRFIEEELGWAGFAGASFAGYQHGDRGGDYGGVVFIRCAPGHTNPLSALYVEAPPEIRRCAPTIDERTYETVRFSATQPARRGPSGIWVLTRWEILQSGPDPLAPFDLVSPDFSGQRVEQVIPPSDEEVTAFLRAFLGARVQGQGAEQFLLPSSQDVDPVPLLYATTSGAAYERSEIRRVQGPVWPNGRMEYAVRLFAEGGTVVEQHFHVVEHDGELVLLYGHAGNDRRTTENGEPVAVLHSELGDSVTFTAPPLVPRGDGALEIETGRSGGRVVIAVDPRPDQGCEATPAPAADAEALARIITAVATFQATQTVPVRVAGTDGLQLDVLFRERSECHTVWMRNLPAGDPGWRMRLYLVDYPDDAVALTGSRVLTIAVIGPETEFERVLEEATPIVESLEFQAG